jgi:hypothetical protein
LRPSIINIQIIDTARVTLDFRINAEAMIAGIGPQHVNTTDAPEAAQYDRLRKLSATQLEVEFDTFLNVFLNRIELAFDQEITTLSLDQIIIPDTGDISLVRLSNLMLTGSIPANARDLQFVWDQKFGNAVLRVQLPKQSKPVLFWIKEGAAPVHVDISDITFKQSVWEVTRNYLQLGFTHIIPKGMDHILFVMGLFLFSYRWKPLLWQVSAFTLAHTVTLVLTALQWINPTPTVVEPLIALSIAYIGIENIFVKKLHFWRTVVVFGFGLLHGLGFGGILLELGLPQQEFFMALITFNAGVELGQISVLAIAALLLFIFRKVALKIFRSKYETTLDTVYHKLIVIPGSLAITAVGLFWAAERLKFI